MSFDAEWDGTVTIDGAGYMVVPLYRSRWRAALARLLRRPTTALSPMEGPGRHYAEGGWLPPRSTTMAVNRTGRWEPVGRPHRPDGGIR